MQKRVEFVNTLRGLAAVCVVISHYFGLFWFNPAAVSALIKSAPLPDLGMPIYVRWLKFHPFFDWGSFGVAIFFLISGFVIPASLARVTGSNFLRKRVGRIVPTYVAGLLLCLLAIAYNVSSTGSEWPFPISHVLVHFVPGLRDVLGTTNIDGIIWTLEIEVKFYLVCALIAPLFKRLSPWAFVAPALLAIVVMVTAEVWNPGFDRVAGRMLFPAQLIVFMFAGTAFYYAHIGAMVEKTALLLAAALMGTFVYLWQVYPVMPLYHAWSYGLAFALFWICFAFPRLLPKNKITDFFADISYPLYVVHGVAGYTLLTILREAGMRSSLALLITTSAALFTAYAVHILIEQPALARSRGTPLATSLPAD